MALDFRKKIDNNRFSAYSLLGFQSLYKRKADGETGFTSVTIKVLTYYRKCRALSSRVCGAVGFLL